MDQSVVPFYTFSCNMWRPHLSANFCQWVTHNEGDGDGFDDIHLTLPIECVCEHSARLKGPYALILRACMCESASIWTQGPTGVRGNGPPNIRLFSLIKNQCGRTALRGKGTMAIPPNCCAMTAPLKERCIHDFPHYILNSHYRRTSTVAAESTTPPPCPPHSWINDLISVFLLTNNGLSGSLHTAQSF